MKDWVVVRSKSGKHPEYGYPIGEILCRSLEDVESAIKNSGMDDPIVEPYLSRVKVIDEEVQGMQPKQAI